MTYYVNSKRLTLSGAERMCETAIAGALAQGIAISVAIVDGGGNLLLLKRMDGGRFHTVHSATTKARTSASNKRITTSQGAVGQDLDVTQALGLALAAGADRWTAMPGGAPVIVDGGECIGGVGVAGGNWVADADLARQAVEAIGASIQAA
jgi:glc operon protein GlcG